MSVQPSSRALPREARRPAVAVDSAEYAQRRAWFCILAAFAIFCALVGWLGLTANTWRKTAYSAPPAQLLSKRGIVLYQGPRDSLPVSIAESTSVSVITRRSAWPARSRPPPRPAAGCR